MDKRRVVVALGHKALGTTLPEQKNAVAYSAKAIADLSSLGCQIAITHSNAPQVGMIHTAMNEFGKIHEHYTMAPMSVCSAMSQGYIGYDLQNAIRSELLKRGIAKTVSTVLTQVKVDPYDEAFYNPVKVIGRVLSEKEAQEEEKKGNYVTKTDDGYRRIVAAPKPQEIIERNAVRALIGQDEIVIACGGGGIPVLEQGYDLKGASAVIEKDLASGLLAKEIDADCLLILTGVEQVYLDYNTPEQRAIHSMTVSEAKGYIDEGQFEENTMLPKIEAAIDFIGSNKNKTAVITSIDQAIAGFQGKTGTLITAE